MSLRRPIPAAGRRRPVKEDKKIGRPWPYAEILERGVDSSTEYEAGIENGDYDEILDASIEFLGECCLKPLSFDDGFIEFPGECCAKPLADEDPRRGPAVPLRGPADTNKKTTTAEYSTPMTRENLIMPERERIVREREIPKRWLTLEVSVFDRATVSPRSLGSVLPGAR